MKILLTKYLFLLKNILNNSEFITTDKQYNPPAVNVSGIIEKHKLDVEDIDLVQPGEFYRRVLKPQ